jgi:hypothetical protein
MRVWYNIFHIPQKGIIPKEKTENGQLQEAWSGKHQEDVR